MAKVTTTRAGTKVAKVVVGVRTMAILDMATAMEVVRSEEVITIATAVAAHMEVSPVGLWFDRCSLYVFEQVDMEAATTEVEIMEAVAKRFQMKG